MQPFFTYYGGKWRAAPLYPAPQHETIVEPFAGAAGYALRHSGKRVILVEKNPVVAALWRWLIAAPEDEIRRLPITVPAEGVDALDVRPEARSLIGFWLNKGAASPCKTPSAWMRQGLRPKSFWGPEIRDRVASQVTGIRHWAIIEGGYECAPDIEATWFVDPPYEAAGRLYTYSSRGIDYAALARWCFRLRGQVMVCENEGATWLPFEPFAVVKSTEGRHGKGQSREALFAVTGLL